MTLPTRKLQRFYVFLLSVFIVLVTLMVIKSQLIRWYMVHWFDNHGVTLEIEQLSFNVYNSNFELEHFVATNESGRRLSVDGLRVDWQWKPLWDRQVVIDEVTVDALKLDVVGQQFKPVLIGPLDLAQFVSKVVEDEPVAEASQPWAVDIGAIKLTDFDVCYRDEKVLFADVGLPLKDANKPLDNCLKWQTLDMDTQLSLGSTGEFALQGNVNFSGVDIKDWLMLSDLTVTELALSSKKLNWTALKLDKVVLFGKPDVSKVIGDSHLSLAALNLAKVEIELDNMNADINQLKLSGLAASHQDGRLSFDDLAVEALVGGSKQLKGEGFELLNVQGNYQVFAGRVGQLVVENFAGNPAEILNVGPSNIDNVTVQQLGKDIVKWDGFSISNVSVDIPRQQAAIQSAGLTGVTVWQKAKDEQHHKAASFDSLEIETAKVGVKSQVVKGLELTGLALLENFDEPNETHPTLVSLKTLNVDSIEVTESINVGKISLNGFDGLLVLHPQDGLNVTKWLYSEPEIIEEQVQDKTAPAAKRVTIDKVTFGDDAKLTLVEHTLGKPQTHQLSKLKLAMTPIVLGGQANEPATASDVDFSAMIEQAGQLSLKGAIVPSNDLQMDLKGKLQHLGLTAYSNYSARHIGYRIEQGQLDVDFNVKVDKGQIDSNFALLLKKFDLGELQQHEQSAANNELGVPIPVALNLLRDNDDNIELSIPISGDLNKPDFSLTSVISTVTFKALKNAVIYTYSPLGMLSVASGLVDLATALRFKPLDFAPREFALDDAAKTQLDKAGKVLSKKSKVDLVLCANATLQDLPVVSVVDSEGKTVVVPHKGGVEALSDEQRKLLLDTAIERHTAAQAYLVAKHNIAAHRMLLCNVKFDDKADSMPEVAVSI